MVDRYETDHEGWNAGHFRGFHRDGGGTRSHGRVKNKPRLPGDRRRPHHMKAREKVRRHMDGHLSVWHGPRLLQRYASDGQPHGKAAREVA